MFWYVLPLLWQERFRLANHFMEANAMDPDQTAPMEQSDRGPFCLQYRLLKNISRREEQTTQVVTGGKGKLISFGIPMFAISAT